MPGNQKSGKLASEAQLRFKGAVMEAMNARRAAEPQLSSSEAGRRLLAKREPLRTQYQHAYLAKGALDKEVKSLQLRLEDLDKEASTLLSGGKGAAVLMSVGLDHVQATLGSDQILVETFRYDHLLEDNKREPRYASTVISASGEPVFISHGAAHVIEDAVQGYRLLIQRSDPDTARLSAEERDELLAEMEGTLHSALLAPLEEYLSSAKTVIFSPDAQLHFLPLGLIRDSEGHTFNDQYRIRYVSSGRDLVKPVLSRGEGQHRALVLGNPSYRDNAPMTALAEAGEEDASEKGFLANNLRAGMDQESGSIQFRPLPGTARETALLAELFAGSGYEVASLGGEEATEPSVMKELGGHNVIHLATHGFFLNEIKIGKEEPEGHMGDDRPKGPMHNPMF
ncbi:MAG: CHAT domain-containing protein, partial [Verrucomicrobiales bacterium]